MLNNISSRNTEINKKSYEHGSLGTGSSFLEISPNDCGGKDFIFICSLAED